MVRKATSQDVADLAGVSRSAVSLVLNGHGDGNISAGKQRAIVEAAASLAYTPNAVALSLRSRRTRTIGVLAWAGDSFTSMAIRAISQTAREAGHVLLIMDSVPEDEAVAILRDRQVDALLVVTPELADYEVPTLMSGGPVVLVNCAGAGWTMPSFAADFRAAGVAMAERARARGHQRIAVLVDERDTRAATRQVLGIREVLERDALPGQFLLSGSTVDTAYAAAQFLLDQPDRPTVLLCTSERSVLGAGLAALGLGLAIPHDLSLLGLLEDGGLSGEFVPRLAGVQRPSRLLGRLAAQALLEQLVSGLAVPDREVLVACPPVAGGSFGPAR